MAIYRGSGGAGDATGDATNASALALAAAAEAQASASSAASSATNAANSASAAASNASTASTAATNASNSAAAAAASETNAATSASSASTSSSIATTKASEASSSASSASTSANAATTQASNAAASASAASTSASNASNSATNAASSATSASSSATAAAASAVTAATFDPALYLPKAGNLSGIANAVTAANNLGINPYGNGFKNRIINGAMQIYQRASNATNVGSSASAAYCTADRYQIYRSGAAPGCNASIGTSGGPTGMPYFSRIQRAAGNATTNALILAQSIESINCYDLAGQPITLSFWARKGADYSAASSVLAFHIQSGTGTNQNLYGGFTGVNTVATSNATLTTSWQQFTVTGTVPANATQIGIQTVFNPTGTAGANDYFDITGVQLEKGSTATSFDYRPYGTELALCQRYYEIGNYSNTVYGVASTTTNTAPVIFKVTKRATPTMTATFNYVNTSSGAINPSGTDSAVVGALVTATGNTLVYGAWVATTEL